MNKRRKRRHFEMEACCEGDREKSNKKRHEKQMREKHEKKNGPINKKT